MPAARFSNREAITTTLHFRASLWKASVLGPGIGSASLKQPWSSRWQKYCERKSSWVQMICAPAWAARWAARKVFFKFAPGSGEQAVWTRPSTTEDGRRVIGGQGKRPECGPT